MMWRKDQWYPKLETGTFLKVANGSKIYGYFIDSKKGHEVARKYNVQPMMVNCVLIGGTWYEYGNNGVDASEINFDLEERTQLLKASAWKKLSREEREAIGLRSCPS